MPSFKITEKHTLSKDEAKLRLTSIVDGLVREFKGWISEPKLFWEDYTANFSYRLLGKIIKGTIKVYDKKIILHSEYPLFLRPLKSAVLEATKIRAKALLGEENKYKYTCKSS